MLLTLSQVSGTYECLRVLSGQGMLVPDVVLEKLSTDKAKWEVDLNALDIVELEDGDIEMTPTPPSRSRDVPIDLPAGVNQHGTNVRVISPDDASNIRDQPDVNT